MNIEEIIEMLSDEYGIKPNTVRRYYDILKEYPVFDDKDAMECLALICSDRVNTAVQMHIMYVSNKTGLCEVTRKMRYKSIQNVIEDVLKDVYEDHYESVEKFGGNSMIYDETEYDVMEREDQVENMLYKYVDQIKDIRLKDREAYEKTKKKNKKN